MMAREHQTEPEGTALFSREAEASVLAAPLVLSGQVDRGDEGERRKVEECILALPPEAFGVPAHRAIATAIQSLVKDGTPVDVVSLLDRLRDHGELKRAGGEEYLAELLDAVPTAANVTFHARIVREKWSRRKLADLTGRLHQQAMEGDTELQELLTDLEAAPDLLPTLEGSPPGRTGAEILADPETADPPREVLPYKGWRGRLTLVSAREKLGKTTVLAAGAASLTRGQPHLGRPIEGPGTVAWWAGAQESTPADVARKLQEFGGDLTRLYLVEDRGDPFELLQRAVDAWEPTILVVDSLSALVQTAGLEIESGDAGRWGRVMNRLGRIARDSGTALVLIHHGRREDGRYRDSTAIGAGADVLVTLTVGEEEGERKLDGVGRWKTSPVRYRLIEPEGGLSRLEAIDASVSLGERILLFVSRTPGASTRQVREGVQGRATEISTAITRLVGRGALRDEGEDGRRMLYIGSKVDSVTQNSANPHGTATEPGGNRSRNRFRGNGGGGGSQGTPPYVVGGYREPPPRSPGEQEQQKRQNQEVGR